MKHIIAITILATACSAALATKPITKPEQGQPSVAATAQANAAAAVVAVQKQAQQQQLLVEARERDPVSTAYSAGLATSNGTCLGSASGGVQGAAVGISLASTKLDTGCDIRYDAAALRAAGHSDAADARLCQKPEIAEAFAAAGKPCTDKRKSAMKTTTAEYTGSDPIVKARLGIAE